jgi:hypothetical protein
VGDGITDLLTKGNIAIKGSLKTERAARRQVKERISLTTGKAHICHLIGESFI